MNPFMTAADYRTPFKALPNTGTRPGFTPTQTRFIKCQVIHVQVDLNKRPNLLFDVRPMADGASSGGAQNDILSVPMLQAGFGNITDLSRSPSGIVYVPEVGSLVLCVFDGTSFCIIGCYTGPSVGQYTKTLDAEGRLVTFQPGIEYGLNRLISPAKYDIPWLFGMDPGDIVLGKDYSRIKVCDRGVFLSGGGTGSLILLKTDGERLDRFSSHEIRGVGYWERHNFTRGTEAAAANNQTNPVLANPPDNGSAYRCQVMETSPYMAAKAPYLVFEKGHVSRGFEQRGRSAIYATATPAVIKAENDARDYCVTRVFIANPLAPQPSPTLTNQSERITAAQANELLTAVFESFDYQLDVDGSYRMRAGNTSQIKNGQGVPPTKEMDLSFEYIAKTLKLLLRLGKAGADITSINADLTQILIHTPNLFGKIDQNVDVNAKKSISLETKDLTATATNNATVKASNIKLDGKTTITKETEIQDNLTVDKNIYCKGIVYAKAFKPIVNAEIIGAGEGAQGQSGPTGEAGMPGNPG